MKRVLITGVTGRSGSWLVRYLSADPHLAEQYIFRFSHRKTSNTSILDDLPFLFEKVEGDLTDEAFCREICTDVDTLFHIAGIHWSIPLVPAAIECGVKRLILVHTTGVYSKYKAAGEEYRNIDNKIEQLVEKADISLTILRPTMVYGTIDDGNISVFLKMVHLLRFFPVVDHAIFALQPVCHKDLGKAYYEVLIHPEETKNKNYILSGGEPILLIDILKTLGHQLGVKNTFISFPFGLFIARHGACIC